MSQIEKFRAYEIPGKSWGTELVFARTATYMGKILRMDAGTGGALQYHREKDEAFYILSGEAIVSWCDDDGVMHSEKAGPGDAYHVPPLAIHHVEALTDCVIVEASNPVFNDRVKIPVIYGKTE